MTEGRDIRGSEVKDVSPSGIPGVLRGGFRTGKVILWGVFGTGSRESQMPSLRFGVREWGLGTWGRKSGNGPVPTGLGSGLPSASQTPVLGPPP